MLSNIRRVDAALNQKPWLVFVFFTLLVIFLRWSSFYQSVIDWDESLYLLVAQAWSKGNPPYTVIWDNKPPGIYAIFLAAIALIGHSVFSIRILACLFIAITCYFLYKIGGLIEGNGKGIGLLAGIFYAVSTLDNGGMAANTEVFFATFVAISAYLLFSNHPSIRERSAQHYWILLLTGLLLGVGFGIKQVVLFDFLALLLILVFALFIQDKSSTKYWEIFRASSILSFGFIFLFLVFSVYFYLIGHFDEYVYANFTANKLRTVDIAFSWKPLVQALIHQIQINTLFWLSIPSTAIYLLIAKTRPLHERWLVFGFIVWFLGILLGISIVFRGYFYDHYFLQLSLPLCLITAYILVRLVFSNTRRNEYPELRQYLILGVLLIALLDSTVTFDVLRLNARYVYFTHVKGIKNWNDTPALIAEYLRPKVKPDNYIYVAEGVPIVYFLVDAQIPTRYAFPSFLLIRPDMPNITGVNPLEELDRILQKQPTYVIKPSSFGDLVQFDENKRFIQQLNQALAKSYYKETVIQEFELYRLSS